MQKTIDAIFENVRAVDDISLHMNMLANAADMMGQERLADELRYMADDLVVNAKAVQTAFSNDSNNELAALKKSTGEIMKVALDSCLVN